MLKLAGELLEGQLAEHIAHLDAHTKDSMEVLRTGEYHLLALCQNGISSRTLATDALYGHIIVVPRKLTVDRIAINITVAASAGKKARLGIYNIGTNLYPGSLLLDAGTVDIDSTGTKEITISQQLAKGLYALVGIAQETATIRAAYMQSPMGLTSGLSDWQCWWYKAGQGYGALPDPFPPSAEFLSGYYPTFFLRVASLD